MTRSLPRITIVTPSLNQAQYLEETIQSVLNQNYPNLEYFIVDGGSTDGSVDIVRKYQQSINWWVSERDKGQTHALNKGFVRSTGELLCWVNADDVVFPNTLEKVIEVLESHPNIDIITGNIVYINENDFFVRCIIVPKMRWLFYRFGVGYFTAPAVFFKRELYERVGGLDINLHYSMDIDLWHKFRLAGAKIYHIKEYLGAFRVHSSSKTGPRMKGEKKYFEHPETTLVRQRYIPTVSKNTIRFFRVLYKLWQIVNLNYVMGWIDLRKWKEKKWIEVFR